MEGGTAGRAAGGAARTSSHSSTLSTLPSRSPRWNVRTGSTTVARTLSDTRREVGRIAAIGCTEPRSAASVSPLAPPGGAAGVGVLSVSAGASAASANAGWPTRPHASGAADVTSMPDTTITLGAARTGRGADGRG